MVLAFLKAFNAFPSRPSLAQSLHFCCCCYSYVCASRSSLHPLGWSLFLFFFFFFLFHIPLETTHPPVFLIFVFVCLFVCSFSPCFVFFLYLFIYYFVIFCVYTSLFPLFSVTTFYFVLFCFVFFSLQLSFLVLFPPPSSPQLLNRGVVSFTRCISPPPVPFPLFFFFHAEFLFT